MAFTQGSRYTLVPDVVDALVATFTAAALSAAASLPPNANGDPAVLDVFDGEPQEVTDNYLAVGFNATGASQAFVSTTGLAVQGTRVLSDVGNRQFGESFTVSCEMSCFTGDSDPGALSRQRRAAGVAVSALWAQLEVDPTLGGIVAPPAYTAVVAFRWLLDRPEGGVVATCQFDVGVVGELWVPR